MTRCPRCETTRVLVVVDVTKQALCLACGARWEQDGTLQRRVRHADAGDAPTRAR